MRRWSELARGLGALALLALLVEPEIPDGA
jgi:hypothetical protein